ncbi:hypothetical protein [Flagellimonas sp. 2504JD4-2]
MINALKTYIEKGRVFHGIEVYGAENALKFQFLEAQVKKKELIVSKQCRADTISELQSIAQYSTPIHVAYNTADVITKIAQQQAVLNGRGAVEQLFPGLNFENFYYQITQLNGKQVVCIVKKDALETFLSQLKEMKLQVVGLSLGISTMENVENHIEQDTVYTHSEKIVFNHDSIEGLSISKSDIQSAIVYSINGLYIESTFLLSFSGVLSFLSPSGKDNTNLEDIVQHLRSEFKNNRTFSLLLRTSLIFILLLLLSNFLAFNSYFTKVEAAREKLAIDNEARKSLILVRERVESKEKKVEAVLSTSNSRTSFYLDRLASSVPPNILLTELQYQPLKKPMQVSKPIELDVNTLLVMGTCSQSEAFSEWIHFLEALEWVKAVETMDYDYRNATSSTFKIKIHVERS